MQSTKSWVFSISNTPHPNFGAKLFSPCSSLTIPTPTSALTWLPGCLEFPSLEPGSPSPENTLSSNQQTSTGKAFMGRVGHLVLFRYLMSLSWGTCLFPTPCNSPATVNQGEPLLPWPFGTLPLACSSFSFTRCFL